LSRGPADGIPARTVNVPAWAGCLQPCGGRKSGRCA
jgi:hypothetical protein